jgi:hypothetical protein
MSFSAELVIPGRAYTVRRLQWSIHQERDHLGRPNAVARGGQIQVEIDSIRDELLVHWMFNPEKKLAGSVRLFEDDSRATLKTVEFANAFCVLLKGSFDGTGNGRSMSQTILISAERLLVRDVELVNLWPA